MRSLFFRYILLNMLMLVAVPLNAQKTLVKPKRPASVERPARKARVAKPVTGRTNGHEWVDLGLSVKWATCNLGATADYDDGCRYAFGETKTKSSYIEENSLTDGKKMPGSIAGSIFFDAAYVNWGEAWRIPTQAELEELIRNCSCEFEIRNGVYGRFFRSKRNGASVFFPLEGYGGTQVYWSANSNDMGYATVFFPADEEPNCGTVYRYFGAHIRPVTE